MSYQDGSAEPSDCPRCAASTLVAQAIGLTVRLSRRHVPADDAAVLHRYGSVVVRVWRGAAGHLLCAMWHPNEGEPDKGRLLIRHVCDYRS